MKRLIPLTAVFACAAAHAALPESPLASQYTINTSETLADAPYEITAGGVLNIGDDAGGSGTLNVLYSEQTKDLFTGVGTMNIGTDSTVGQFYLTGTNSNFPSGSYSRVMKFTGTINVNAMGSFIIDGYYPSTWGALVELGLLNLRGGAFTTSLTASSTSYVQITNLNFYKGSSLYSSQNLITGNSGVWNLYDSGLRTYNVRVGSDANASVTMNLRGENVLKDVSNINFDTNDVTLNLNVGDYANTINAIGFNTNSTLNIGLEANLNPGSVLSILKIGTKENKAFSQEGSSMSITNFANDAIFIGDANGITIDGDRLYVADYDIYITLAAYSTTGEEILGDWSLDWDDERGLFALNNTGAIPEPGACAAAFGVLALAYAARRWRN